MEQEHAVCSLRELTMQDVGVAGGKNASLGEMISQLGKEGVRVPEGFVIKASGYIDFLRENKLEKKMAKALAKLTRKPEIVHKVGKAVRKMILKGKFPEELKREICWAYRALCKEVGRDRVDVAVRSSATAEDLPGASFAGQQETYLNIRGEKDLIESCRKCYSSLFTDRAISYREEKGFDHMKVAISVGVQRMVRSDKASSGVLFTLHTETGFDQVVVINASWGLGENVVQGNVIPDEFLVFKPLLEKENVVPIIEKKLGSKELTMVYSKVGGVSTKNIATPLEDQNIFSLTDEEVLALSRWGVIIEKHYGRPMDIEWAKDGETEELFIVQARPETVQSEKKGADFITYTLKKEGKKLLEGLAVGDVIRTGKPQIIKDVHEIDHFREGSILVTTMTDPDWVPIMKMAKGIITDQGGRTSHAAIVSRELGIPAIVGCGDATDVLRHVDEITMSCSEGDKGVIYEGTIEFEERAVHVEEIPTTKTRVMLNIANPAAAFRWWKLPCKGIGLARMEFIISDAIKIHPIALAHFDLVKDKDVRMEISELTLGYEDKSEYFIHHLAEGIAQVASTRYPEPVIVRMSDFKTSEYANLIGGKEFEPFEENPMIGFRGASRYYHPKYRDGFRLECLAIKRVREEIGLSNVLVMIPFCRTIEEADKVLTVMAEDGLKRGENGLQIYVMAEIPSNVILASEFAERFDGFSIGSNDLTQLVLGIDRNSRELAPLFDERNMAVKIMIENLIKIAHEGGCKVGICGQAPSDYPEFAEFLVKAGIDSISLNPDSVIRTIHQIAELER